VETDSVACQPVILTVLSSFLGARRTELETDRVSPCVTLVYFQFSSHGCQ
jgi:hypothetical protein